LLRLFSDKLLIGDDILEDRAMTLGRDNDPDDGPLDSPSKVREADPARPAGND
jgi:hypothetical protein